MHAVVFLSGDHALTSGIVWNGDGGNVERPDRQHCSGWQVPWLGSLGGFYYDRTDVDLCAPLVRSRPPTPGANHRRSFSYWGIRHTAYWTQTKTLRQVGPYEWTKITSKETAVCENVNEKPYCKITGIW